MAGLLDEIRKSEALAQVQQRLQGLLNIPTAAQQFMVSPASFMGLLGRNPLPRETGFAAGATGLPAQEMSVLDPNQAPYMQGYSQGEPVGYAGLALPLAAPAAVAGAKALGPKAGQALESYMVNQGMIQPLTAYHGTPHTIQGKFDINKVGTGEGSQAYGHGMYFAENPKVAIGYRDALAVDPNLASEKLQFKTLEAFMPTEKKAVQGEIQAFLDGTGNYNNFVRVINQEGSDALKKALLKEEPNLFSAGNLYKVDIPDADIAKMLDWDKPLSEMTKKEAAIIEPLKQALINRNNPYDPKSFETIGQVIQSSRGINPNLEKQLLEAGIPGIKYLDEGSRAKGQGTRNFVVFDPSDIKILEKNSEKVEGLLD